MFQGFFRAPSNDIAIDVFGRFCCKFKFLISNYQHNILRCCLKCKSRQFRLFSIYGKETTTQYSTLFQSAFDFLTTNAATAVIILVPHANEQNNH